MDVDRPRGQLTLAAALLLAVLLVATAIVLNTVLVTQNRATQSGPDDVDPESYRAAVETQTAGALLRINRNNTANESHAALREELEAAMGDWQTSSGRHYAASGRVADSRIVTVDNGTRIRQNVSSRNLTDNGGQSNWTLVRDVEDAHRFELNVSVDSMFDATGSTNMSTIRDESLHVTVVTDVDTWRVFLFRNASRGELDVLVENRSDSFGPDDGYAQFGSEICEGGAGHVTVRLVDGLVGNDSCDDLLFLRGLAALDLPYDVHYNRSAGKRGTYDFFVDRASVDGTPYEAMGSGQPFRQLALFSARVEVRFENGDVDYRTTSLVWPAPAPH